MNGMPNEELIQMTWWTARLRTLVLFSQAFLFSLLKNHLAKGYTLVNEQKDSFEFLCPPAEVEWKMLEKSCNTFGHNRNPGLQIPPVFIIWGRTHEGNFIVFIPTIEGRN